MYDAGEGSKPGIVLLEQHLVAHDVLGGEPNQDLHELDERFAWVVASGVGPDELEELAIAVGEHQVVEPEL